MEPRRRPGWWSGWATPGKEYAGNRHNVGFLVADLLADRIGAKFGRHKRAVADVAEGRLGIGVTRRGWCWPSR